VVVAKTVRIAERFVDNRYKTAIEIVAEYRKQVYKNFRGMLEGGAALLTRIEIIKSAVSRDSCSIDWVGSF